MGITQEFMNDDSGLVYVGKIVEVHPIAEADLLVSVSVVCGNGGKWRGVVRKNEFSEGDKCLVFLPDSLLPETDEMRFMESRGWRVRMCRFRGAPSEVLIRPLSLYHAAFGLPVGSDVTIVCGVKKYHKPIPAQLGGIAIGEFPQFIPKTDEPNYQTCPELIEDMAGLPYYVTVKMDGSSTTAYRYKGDFGVCSRNFELIPDMHNGYWKVADKYQLQSRLPSGVALQWETCGPKIQKNPSGLKDIDGFAFSAYDIMEQKYFEMDDLIRLCKDLAFPMVDIVRSGESFDVEQVEGSGEGTYSNGAQREGVVYRSQHNVGYRPISFKVINLSYEK